MFHGSGAPRWTPLGGPPPPEKWPRPYVLPVLWPGPLLQAVVAHLGGRERWGLMFVCKS
jgi:hypothetical protein